MEKPLGFSDAVASGSIKRISSFFIYMGFKSVDWIKVIKQNPDEIASAGLYFIFYLNVAT
jgi:hypothetical protein